MDPFLIITAAVFTVLILVVCFFIMVYFAHEDDKNSAKFPRIVVVTGLALACCAVLVLPLDVANQRGFGGGLDIEIVWKIIFILQAVYLTILIPFAQFYYESDMDEETRQKRCRGQFCTAVWYTVAFFLVFAIICAILYAVANSASIPVAVNSLTPDNLLTLPANGLAASKFVADKAQETEFTWTLDVTFPVFLIAVLSFLGSFLYMMFVGIGLVALPLDLINDWRTRPASMNVDEYARRRKAIGERARVIREAGETLLADMKENVGKKQKRKDRKSSRKTTNQLEKAVYLLQKDKNYLDLAFHLKGGNPLVPWSKLFVGVFGVVISLTWIVHICVFVLPPEPAHPFLNDMFIDLETKFIKGFPLLGVVFFGFWAFYLLWAVIKGAFRFGLRVPMIMKIYPMELHNTLMNAFLVNTWLIILLSIPLVQFCATCFPIYARNTAINMIFGNQVKYMDFFKYFFDNNVFTIGLLVFVFLTTVALIVKPRDKAQEVEDRLELIARGEVDD